MSGYGLGSGWMMLMPLVWIALVAAGIWAIARLLPRQEAVRVRARRESPLEILDRRYARGEIDDDAYAAARARLTGRR